jgi:hypothetical protein
VLVLPGTTVWPVAPGVLLLVAAGDVLLCVQPPSSVIDMAARIIKFRFSIITFPFGKANRTLHQ